VASEPLGPPQAATHRIEASNKGDVRITETPGFSQAALPC